MKSERTASKIGEPTHDARFAFLLRLPPVILKATEMDGACTMVTKDVSATGMSILHTATVRDRLLMVSFPQSTRTLNTASFLK